MGQKGLLVESGDNLRQGMAPGQRGPQAPPVEDAWHQLAAGAIAAGKT
jgi:hypothetical protein